MLEKTVVVIEPDTIIREALRTLINTLGFPVECFSGGITYLDSLSSRLANDGCILVESTMPELDGLAFLRRFKGRGEDIPVILLVSRVDQAIVDKALSAGATDVVSKPFTTNRLLETIIRLMK